MTRPTTIRGRVALGLGLCLALAACSAGSPQGAGAGAGQQAEGEGGGGGGTIGFLHWRGEDSAAFTEIIGQFTEETGIDVNMNVLPSDAYEGQAEQQLRGAGGADVFAAFPGSQFIALADAGVFADLSDAEFRDRFDDRLIEAGRDQTGAQLAYPYQVVFNIPVYNRGMFEEMGLEPPPDWDGFLNLCEQLKAAGVVPILWAGDVSASQFINPMMMNNMPDEDIWARVEAGEAKVTDEWFVKTLSQIAELNERGCFQDDALGTRTEGAIALFSQERGAMLATGSYHMAAVLEQNPDMTLGLLAPITVPADEAVWEGINTTTFMLAVNSASDSQEEAAQFIEFLSRPEVAGQYANATGQLVTVTDVEYTTDALLSQTEWLEKNTRFQPRYLITEGAINDGVQDAVDNVLSGVAPEAAAQELQALIDRTVGA